jgi:hypothetical protein
MRAKLEGFSEYEAIARDFNTIGLIKLIKSTVYKFQSQRHPGLLIHTAKRHFYLLEQEKHATNNDYLDMFSNNTDVIKHIAGGHRRGAYSPQDRPGKAGSDGGNRIR